jgi:5-oxoprolinase (ATP-hydrolysing) subunit A
MEIDLNCDLGEGCGADADLMPLITSASIACGFHAGNAWTALAGLRLGASHNVALGAHPGHNDREHFGRRELNLTPKQIFADCVYQIGALAALSRAVGVRLRHVKPHGALYHQANADLGVAQAVVAAVELFSLALMGLPGSQLEAASQNRCPYLAEGFADRRYLPNGCLVPRTRDDAFVHDAEEAVRQAEWLIREKGVRTLCVHGDNPQALLFVQTLRQALQQRGIAVRRYADSPVHE